MKIYLVRSHFEDYESTTWKIIGLFIDEKLAKEVSKKWEDFYEDKSSIFKEPKGWVPSESDMKYGELDWIESEEYSRRCAKYSEIRDFRDIVIEEYEINKDMSMLDSFIDDDMISLMTQWDRNYKLDKLI